MPAAVATPELPPAVAYTLPGVRLFASGHYRGRDWFPRDIVRMARNARVLAPVHTPPAAPGHEDDDGWQTFVGDVDADGPRARTDEPAAGWVHPATVRAAPDPDHPGHLVLVGDVVNVPPEMAEMIRTGRYQTGSSEIYQDFTDDFGKSHGKTLRKFSYLGAEVPQVKRLGPLPMPVPQREILRFAERRAVVRERRVAHGGTVFTYAETTAMDRASMTAAIQAALPGISQATLEGMSDEALADLVKNLPAAAPAAPPAPPAGLMAEGDPPAEEAPAGPTREEMVAALVEEGLGEAAELEAMPEEELAALYEELMAADAAAPAEPAAPPAAMSERRAPKARPAAAALFAEQRKAMARLTRLSENAERANRRILAAERETRRRDVDSFCEQLVREGRWTPAQVQVAVKPLLLALDHTRPVHTFADNGRTRKVSAYELKRAELARSPVVVRFGERLAGGTPAAGEDEVRKVREFAQAIPETAFAAGGKTREQFVETFAELRKKKPALTAKEYCGS